MYLEINVNLYNYNSYIRTVSNSYKEKNRTYTIELVYIRLFRAMVRYRTVRDLLTSLQIQQHVQVNNLANISSNFFLSTVLVPYCYFYNMKWYLSRVLLFTENINFIIQIFVQI